MMTNRRKMERMKPGEIKYLIKTGWSIEHKPAWAIWKVKVTGDMNKVLTGHGTVKLLEKKISKFFAFKRNSEYPARSNELFDEFFGAKRELLKRITENRLW